MRTSTWRSPTLLLLATVVAAPGCERAAASWMDASVPTPTVFAPGIVSGPQRDYDITFTPDGTEAYFTRRARRGPPGILRADLVDGVWSDVRPASFSGDRDEAPFVSPDGRHLFFSSRRRMDGGAEASDDLWVVERRGDGWGEPTPVRGTVNRPREQIGRYTLGTEVGPALSADGSLLYSTRVDPEWGSDLYVATAGEGGAFTDPRPLRLNSYGDETNPVVAPGGDYIVFQAYRDADGYGEQDLYAAERTPYGWSDPVLLPEPINSSRTEGWPSFSPDGRHFFFASDRARSRGFYDVYWVDAGALGLPGLPPRSPGSRADDGG